MVMVSKFSSKVSLLLMTSPLACLMSTGSVVWSSLSHSCLTSSSVTSCPATRLGIFILHPSVLKIEQLNPLVPTRMTPPHIGHTDTLEDVRTYPASLSSRLPENSLPAVAPSRFASLTSVESIVFGNRRERMFALPACFQMVTERTCCHILIVKY